MFVLRLLTGSTEAVVFLHVKVPPSIAGIQGPRKIGVGQNTSFFCRMKEGDPEPSFTWTKDGDKLVTSKDQRVVVENDKVRLKVVQKQDGGFYSCTADNEVGEGENIFIARQRKYRGPTISNAYFSNWFRPNYNQQR